MSGAMLLWQIYVSHIVSRKRSLALCSAYVILYLSLWYWIHIICLYMHICALSCTNMLP